MTRARGILALLLALCTLAVAGCAGFPTDAPPQYGLENGSTGDGSQNVAFIPNRPQPGATAEQIVEGFIDAGSGPGILGDWGVAREFLAPEIAKQWKPEAGVMVDERAERSYTETEDGVVEFAYDAVATVDDKGSYEAAGIPEDAKTFTLAKQSDGEWRITQVPADGVWLDEAQFPTVFHRYPLMYFDPTGQYLVPDVRWFTVAKAPTNITDALVNKPVSEWLTGAVVNAFPDGVTAVPSVTVEDGVAQVELSERAVGASGEELDRMLTQLRESLRAAGVTDVVMSVGSTPIDAQPVAVRSTRVPAAPLVLTADGFGFLTGDEIDRIPGLSAAVESAAPVSVQVAPERDFAAARLASGVVVRLGAEGAPQTVDTRAGLIDPTIDGSDIVWSVPRDQPTALHATLPSGDVVDVADAWNEATAITAMALSRDGTRIAAVVTAGGRTVLWVAGVIRDREGVVPVSLGTPLPLAVVGAPGVGVTWIDDMSIAVLGNGEGESIVVEQPVGGPTGGSSAAAGMTSIAGGTGLSSLRLLAPDGTVYVKRGTAWQPTASDVLVLATQQGSPQ